MYSHSEFYLSLHSHSQDLFFLQGEYCQQEVMAPHRGEKKKVQDQSVEEPNPNSDLYSDTTACLTGSIKSWVQVYEILEEEKSTIFDDESEEEDVLNINKLKEVAKSKLHKVAARPKLFPYTDMIRWALEHVDIPTRTIYNHQRTIFGSF
jgi:hypothetical protein